MQRNQLNIEWILENHLSFLHKFGLNESKIREHFEVWKVGKISTSVNDYFWYILQNILTEIAAQVSDEEQMCQLNYDTYYIMWEFLSYVENKNGNHIKRLMHKNEIRLWQIREGIFKKNVVIISNKCCDYCKTLNDKYVSFEEALEKEYLASTNCTNEYGCNCCYSVMNCRDDNDRLIRVQK